MGWQLVPVGIGWRSFDKTLEEGRFSCENPRCKGRVEPTQPYRLRRSRNWFTVLFIPIIPLNMKGVYVECRSCKSIFHAAVLREQPGQAPQQSTFPAVSIAGDAPAPFSPPAASNEQPVLPSTADSFVSPTPPVEAATAQTAAVGLLLGDGRRVDLLQPTVLGRAPSPGAATGAMLCAVDDPTMTASKTHALFHLQSGALRVRDLGTANGTVVLDSDGSEHTLRNDEFEVDAGMTVRLGRVEVRVVAGDRA